MMPYVYVGLILLFVALAVFTFIDSWRLRKQRIQESAVAKTSEITSVKPRGGVKGEA